MTLAIRSACLNMINRPVVFCSQDKLMSECLNSRNVLSADFCKTGDGRTTCTLVKRLLNFSSN